MNIVDSYVLIRSTTLAWLLECVREDELRYAVPPEVARDLAGKLNAGTVPAPVDPGRTVGLAPVLTPEEHMQLMQEDASLGLPADRRAGEFWRTVVKVVHAFACNEAEATLRLLGGDE